jgi:hypothetical protein
MIVDHAPHSRVQVGRLCISDLGAEELDKFDRGIDATINLLWVNVLLFNSAVDEIISYPSQGIDSINVRLEFANLRLRQ